MGRASSFLRDSRSQRAKYKDSPYDRLYFKTLFSTIVLQEQLPRGKLTAFKISYVSSCERIIKFNRDLHFYTLPKREKVSFNGPYEKSELLGFLQVLCQDLKKSEFWTVEVDHKKKSFPFSLPDRRLPQFCLQSYLYLVSFPRVYLVGPLPPR